MDSAKLKEEVQNSSTTSTTSLEEEIILLEGGSSATESKIGQVKEDSSGDVGSTTTEAVTPPPTSISPSTDSGEGQGQGVKRPREVNDPSIPNSSSDDNPKAKLLRKDDEESLISDQVDTSSCPNAQFLDKEQTADVETGRTPIVTVEAPKVPPIKIVLQSHSSTEAESMATVSQPHVVTATSTSGFPYIVSADSSGIPASSPLAKDNKGRDEGVQPNQEPQVEGTKKDKQESLANSDSPKSSSTLDVPDVNQKGSDNMSTSQSSLTFDERSTLDGTQSPSLLGNNKEKPTRVTRSSQRMATTVYPSPAASPKIISTCSSPTQMEVNSANTTELLSATQETTRESSPAPRNQDTPAELHPRKRKLKTKEKEKDKEKEKEKELVKEPPIPPSSAASNISSSSSTSGEAGDGPGGAQGSVGNNASTTDPSHPILNCVEMYLNIRKQIERRRQNLFPVQPKPPQGFKDYLMNRGTYVLSTTPNAHLAVPSNSFPPSLPPPLKDLFLEQEKERHRLRLQQVVEKEKLVLSVEQEILRVHGRAARALSNQALPFSVCTFLKDEEVYNLLTPEQEEKDRNVRSRYNGRLFLSWLQDVDDKWEKIKESMVLRHHNEAESLYAVQKMDWEWKMKEVGLCEPKATPVIDEISVPMVFVSDDFDLLPA